MMKYTLCINPDGNYKLLKLDVPEDENENENDIESNSEVDTNQSTQNETPIPVSTAQLKILRFMQFQFLVYIILVIYGFALIFFQLCVHFIGYSGIQSNHRSLIKIYISLNIFTLTYRCYIIYYLYIHQFDHIDFIVVLGLTNLNDSLITISSIDKLNYLYLTT